jgi:hypothetical protein
MALEIWKDRTRQLTLFSTDHPHSRLLALPKQHCRLHPVDADGPKTHQMSSQRLPHPPAAGSKPPLPAMHILRGQAWPQSNRFPMQLYYTWFRCSLQQEVRSRREIGHLFPEYQLWYLLLVLLKVATFFEEEGSYLGNLHPSNLFLDEGGRASLFIVFTAPH